MAGIETEIQEVSSTVDAMGYVDRDGLTYTVSPDTSECLRELLRALRRDRHGFPILRHLGALNIVERDLLPMVKLNMMSKDEKLYEFLVRLLVTLTYPALIHFKEKLPENASDEKTFLSINQTLRSYKLAFSRDVKVWTVFAENIKKITSKDYAEITEDEKVLLERILVLIRNVVHVPRDELLENAAQDDELIQEDMIDTFTTSGILEMILKMCGEPDFHQFAFHCLEILFHLFKEQSPEFIATSDIHESNNENCGLKNSTRGSELIELRELERQQKRRNQSYPYNRFKDATYVVKNMKSISAKDLIIHKTVEDASKVNLDHGKQSLRRAKNRRPMADDSSFKSTQSGINYRRPSKKVTRQLRGFCSKLVSNVYNKLMDYVRSALERNQAQENDDTYYFWAAHFFMEYNRASKADAKFVEETISTDYFHHLHTTLEHHLDMIGKEKSEVKAWSRRLHTALRAYKELVFTVATIKSKDERVLKQAAAINNMMLYEIDYRELLLCLISGFNELKMCRGYLKDLIETNHVFLKMLESLSKSDDNIVVKTKKKASKKKKSVKKTNKSDDGSSEIIWSEIAPEISDAIDGKSQLPQPEDDPDVIPYSALSEKSRDEQKVEVLYKIHRLLKRKKATAAVALYRNAREYYIEDADEAFGAKDASPEEEMLGLHDLIVSDLWTGMKEEVEEDDPKLEEGEGEDSEEEGTTYKTQKFDFLALVFRYAHAKVVKALIMSLKSFETNSNGFNHAILKLCHRIAWDCKAPVFFFQLSLFNIFKKCFEASRFDSKDRYQELKSFACFIIKSFGKMAKGNNKLLVELLFYKTKKEVSEIVENYVKPEPKEKPRAPKNSRKKSKKNVSDSEGEPDEDKDEAEKYEAKDRAEKDEGQNEIEKELDDDPEEFEKLYAGLDSEDDGELEDYNEDANVKSQPTGERSRTIIEKVFAANSTSIPVSQTNDGPEEEELLVRRKKRKVSHEFADEDSNDSNSLKGVSNLVASSDGETAAVKRKSETFTAKRSSSSQDSDEDEPVVIKRRKTAATKVDDLMASSPSLLNPIDLNAEVPGFPVSKRVASEMSDDIDQSANLPQLAEKNLPYDSDEDEMASVVNRKRKSVAIIDDDED